MREPEGFREFVAARQGSLLRSAWLLTGDWQGAEDLVQTALAKVWPRWEKVVSHGDPEAYVRRTLVTTYLSWRRRRWTSETPTAEPPEPSSHSNASSMDAVELRDTLRRILPNLTRQQRTILMLRFYQDLSVEETASIVGCSAGTVKSQTSKALAKLNEARSKEGAK